METHQHRISDPAARSTGPRPVFRVLHGLRHYCLWHSHEAADGGTSENGQHRTDPPPPDPGTPCNAYPRSPVISHSPPLITDLAAPRAPNTIHLSRTRTTTRYYSPAITNGAERGPAALLYGTSFSCETWVSAHLSGVALGVGCGMCDTAMSDSVSGVEMVGVVIWATLLAVFVGTEADVPGSARG